MRNKTLSNLSLSEVGRHLPIRIANLYSTKDKVFCHSSTLADYIERKPNRGIYLNLRGTSAQLVCASYVWKTNPLKGNLKAVVSGYRREASLLWVKTTVEGIISKYRIYQVG